MTNINLIFRMNLFSESTMDDLFEKSDIISFHIPLTDETTYLCNKDFLEKFKKKIYLINTSRGKVVKTATLVEQLENGKVLGLALMCLKMKKLLLKVWQTKTFLHELKRLFQMKNVILSPHIAGWTHESNLKMALSNF